jgi:ketosteroid isomerase-like protein
MGTRAVVEQYFAAMNEGRAADMDKLKAPHSAYWMSGEGSWPFGGDMSGEKFAQLWAIVQHRFVEGPTLVVKAIIAEGQRAAVHIQVRALRQDGRLYDNQVVMLMTVVDGLITEQCEFLDTIKVNELFCGPLDEE